MAVGIQTDHPSAPRITIDDPGSTFGLEFRTRRSSGPTDGFEVELVRTTLFGEATSAGLALLPDDGGMPRWLRAPERSDAGRILQGVVEALTAPGLPSDVAVPALTPPRAQVTRTAEWDGVVAPNGLVAGLAEGDSPSRIHQALGGAWTLVLDDAPDLPVAAHLWLQHRMEEDAGETVILTATWHGPGAEQPWHTELHVTHREHEDATEFVVTDGSTEEAWTVAEAIHRPGAAITWRVHPAPRPDESTLAGEAMYALILALAAALDV